MSKIRAAKNFSSYSFSNLTVKVRSFFIRFKNVESWRTIPVTLFASILSLIPSASMIVTLSSRAKRQPGSVAESNLRLPPYPAVALPADDEVLLATRLLDGHIQPDGQPSGRRSKSWPHRHRSHRGEQPLELGCCSNETHTCGTRHLARSRLKS